MPFTPSHAVVALPFLRTPLVPAAIAVGAMSPDLPLFLRGMPLHYGMTHSLVWLPLTIADALVLLLVWRCLLRPATLKAVVPAASCTVSSSLTAPAFHAKPIVSAQARARIDHADLRALLFAQGYRLADIRFD